MDLVRVVVGEEMKRSEVEQGDDNPKIPPLEVEVGIGPPGFESEPDLTIHVTHMSIYTNFRDYISTIRTETSLYIKWHYYQNIHESRKA